MTQPPKKKRQHFVPQWYLRLFRSNPGEQEPGRARIWTLDKPTMDVRNSRVHEVASRRNFHDVAVPGDEEMFENLFAEHLEPNFQKIHLGLLRQLQSQGWFGPETKIKLAPHLVIQHFRTAKGREELRVQADAVSQAMFQLAQQMKPEFRELELRTSIGAGMHMDFTLDLDHVMSMAEQLCRHVWLVARVKDGSRLWTSDAPLASERRGWGAPGASVVFPLDPRHLLHLIDRQAARREGLEELEGHILLLQRGGAEYYNLLQLARADRQVFSPNGEFAGAEHLRARHPGLFEPRQSSTTTRLIPHAEFEPGPEGLTLKRVSDLEPDEQGLPLMDIVVEGTTAPLRDLREIAHAVSADAPAPRRVPRTR